MLKQSVSKAGIRKPVTLHWLRYSYATHLPDAGTDLRFIQALPGHSSVKTNTLYIHLTKKGVDKIKSPLDRLMGEIKK